MSLLSAQGMMMAGGGGGGVDPYFSSRVAVLNLNTDLTDAKGKIWTAQSEAHIEGGYLKLDGSWDCLSADESDDFDFGSGAFCVEATINLPFIPGSYTPIIAKWKAGSLGFYFGVNGSGRLVLFIGGLSNNYFPEATAPAPTIPINTDTHVAGYKIGNNYYVAVNGTPQNILSTPDPIRDLSIATVIGAQSDATNSLNGRVKGARLTKGGTGGYGASPFTPPPFPLPTSGP